jgi:predicted metal-dependent phosphoesterase TrpH
MAFCDLQLHSTHSDGTDTPRRIVELAAAAGLAAIALTDHDTTTGLTESKAAGEELGVRVISGVEITCEYGGKSMDMLGYCFDSGADELQAKLARIQEGRRERNLEIIGKLNALGHDITYDEVAAEADKADGKIVGRPHFATVMIRKGIVTERQEAFDKFLAEGGSAYVPKLAVSPEECVQMLQEAGGLAVLAHPKLVRFPKDKGIRDLLQALKGAGLAGIECYYSLHSDEETATYLELAKEFDLLVTGGSDYHGNNKPEISVGTGMGNLRVPVECAERLMAAAAKQAV